MAICGDIEAESQPLVVKSILGCNVNERCMNEHCDFKPHPYFAKFCGYCCKKCAVEKFKGRLDGRRHGARCQKVPADEPRWHVVDTDRGHGWAIKAAPPRAADDDMDGGRPADGIGLDDEDALERQELPDMVIWGNIVRDSNPVVLDCFLTRCLNARCGFQPHPRVDEFYGFCCKKCGINMAKEVDNMDRGHGWQCQQIKSGPDMKRIKFGLPAQTAQ